MNEGDGLPFGRSRIRAYRELTSALSNDDLAIDGAISPSSEGAEDYTRAAECVPEDTAFAREGDRAVSAEIDILRREIVKVQSAIDVIKTRKDSSGDAGHERKEWSVMGRVHPRRVSSKSQIQIDAALEKRRANVRALERSVPEPATRGMAIVLLQHLDEVLPEGAIENKYARLSARGGLGAAELSLAHHSTMQIDAFSGEFAVLDGAFREGARQVSAGCRDRGELLDLIRERYGELFSTMRNVCDRWQRRNDSLLAQLDELQCMLAAKERERVAFTEYVTKCRREVATARREQRCDSEQAAAMLTRAQLKEKELATLQNIDRAEIRRLQERIKLADAQSKHEIVAAVTSMEDSLSNALDDRDQLEQRVRYLNNQLCETRALLPDRSAYETIETQTAFDAASVKELLHHEDHGVTVGIQTDAVTIKRRRKGEAARTSDHHRSIAVAAGVEKWKRDTLGGFATLVASQRSGRQKPRAWVLKCIAQIYSDKLALDATDQVHADDTVKDPTIPPLAVFVYDWHLHKFGLRQLAETNLLDLVASTTYHADESAVISQFGVFCGFIPSDEALSAHLSLTDASTIAFYLQLVDSLANANLLSQLFLDYGLVDDAKQLDAGSDVGSMPITRASDALKRVFIDFKDDGGALKEFIAKNLGVKHATSSSTVKFAPFMRAVMEEYRLRRQSNLITLKALFCAADLSDAGVLVYDEFHAAFRVADAKLADAAITKAFQTFSTKREKRTEPFIYPDDFIKACLTNGLDKFRLVPERVAHDFAGEPATSAPSTHDIAVDDVAAPTPSSTSTSTPSTSSAWLALLDVHMSSADGALARLESLRQTSCAKSILDRCDRQFARVQHLKSTANDGEAAYLSYKLLAAHVRSANVKSKGGFKRLGDVVLTRVCFSMRAARAARARSPSPSSFAFDALDPFL